jgi:hypothetical protein
MSRVTYNERSWAIDIISEISIFSSNINKSIKRAGGESTINTGSKRFFPDVLLYGEHSDILMGWELKMPDTALTDSEFISNAAIKADILGLNSFLLWNAHGAVLYIKNDTDFEPLKNWDTSHDVINSRKDVLNNRDLWISSLHEILKDLNNYFETGTLHRKPIIESFKNNNLINFILQNSPENALALENISKTDSLFGAEVNIWWRVSKNEYPNHNKWDILAEIILVNWINKILFANILTAFYDEAQAVFSINITTTPNEASDIFQLISSSCDFWNIFQPQLGEENITHEAWNEIVQLNLLLKDFELASIGQELLQSLLENVIYTTKRKVSGQFTTPMNLARLLVHLTALNKTETIHDPCCGTGTIPRASYDIKKEAGIDPRSILDSIYASDKVAFPLQMATLAISEPENMGNIIQIFKSDATDLEVNMTLELRDPFNGEIVHKNYDPVAYITSNLPFIQQEDLAVLNPNIRDRTNTLIESLTGQRIKLHAKSDLYAYIPFYLWHLLKENGRLGIIVSNSWLGTKWGKIFKEAITKIFNIELILTSGNGRWFHNAEVVTNIIVLNKKSIVGEIGATQKTKFITLKCDIHEIEDNTEIEEIFEAIITNTYNENIDLKEYNTNYIMNLPLNWNTLFGDISWLNGIENKLIYCNTLFEINRGRRRGWNDMFYPEQEHGIEQCYIKPVLRTSKHIHTMLATAETEAFCCSKSEEELQSLQHNGTLSWINRFRNEFNTNGDPLVPVLEKSAAQNEHWYEMNDSTMADLVASMNFNHRMFIAKLDTRSFVDQRLTRFSALNQSIDIELSHALLNSILGIFFIEALGFGRGLGALDLSSTRMKKHLRMLNPNILSQDQIQNIKQKFRIISAREILPIETELLDSDRIAFDNSILEAFGILNLKTNIVNSFLYLYRIRTTVQEEL